MSNCQAAIRGEKFQLEEILQNRIRWESRNYLTDFLHLNEAVTGSVLKMDPIAV